MAGHRPSRKEIPELTERTIVDQHHVESVREGAFDGEGPVATSQRQGVDGGAEGDRTPDLGIANAALSQLSYSPTRIISANWWPNRGAFATPDSQIMVSPLMHDYRSSRTHCYTHR